MKRLLVLLLVAMPAFAQTGGWWETAGGWRKINEKPGQGDPVLIDTAAQPSCTSAIVGTIWRSTSANVDTLAACLQTGAATYEWKDLAAAGGTTVLGYWGDGTNTYMGSGAQPTHWATANSTYIGAGVGANTTNGDNSTAIGYRAMYSRKTSNNVAIGNYALATGHAAGNNIGIGNNAGENALDANVYIGHTAGSVLQGNRNVGIGYYSMTGRWQHQNDDNVAVGNASLRELESGDWNTAIGSDAGHRTGASPATGNALKTGSNNTFIGAKAGLASSTQRTNATAIGFEAYVDADNTVVLGDENVTQVLAGSAKQAALVGDKLTLDGLNTAPATSTEACAAGETRFTADYIYVCTATNTWKRATLATF